MDKVTLEEQGKVAVITINRPDKRNALNQEVRSELFKCLKEVESRKEIRATIITGAGDSFVAGADIVAMSDYTPQDARKASKHGSDIFLYIEKMRIPIIAAVNGWALGGGCELAMACDLRICSNTAKFGQPEVNVGIIPGYGAQVRLTRLIGPGKTKELIFTGRIIDATEAEKIGLVNKKVAKDDLMSEAMKMAQQFAEGPAAISLAKKSINEALTLGENKVMDFLSELYGEVYKTHDAREGIIAHIEKRKPIFKGR
jgi:enoyl-CoA hydratase